MSSDRLAGLNGRRPSLRSLASTDLSLSCNLPKLVFTVDKEVDERRSRILADRKCVATVEVGVCEVTSSSPSASESRPSGSASNSAFSRSVSEPEAFEMDSVRRRAREEEDPAELEDEGAGERRLRMVVGEGVERREPDEIDASLSRT